MANPMTGYPFNGSDDPVYQEVMWAARASIERALETLHTTLDTLDGHDETTPEYHALREVVAGLDRVGAESFDIEGEE